MASLYHQVVAEHHARLERIAEKRGVARLRRLYDESQAEVAARVKRLVRGGRGSSFTAHQKRTVLAQLTHGQAQLVERMGGELSSAARDAQHDVLRALSRDINRLDARYTGAGHVLPVEDAARFAGVIDKRKTSLLKRHESSLERYGTRNIAKMEDALGKSLLSGESQMEAIDRITDVMDGQWYAAERIVRTEMSWASAATQTDGIISARQVIPDLLIQWRELVSDDGEPLDDRVGVDSLALHGQVAVPGQMFICPPRSPNGESVGDALALEEIAHPPNRPNDRATVAPWRSDWGEPGWKWIAGRRVPMR